MIIFAAVAAYLSGYLLSGTTCTIAKKSFAENDGFKVEYVDYEPPARASGAATTFIMPPTGGTTPLDRRFATGLCREGRHVLIVEDWSTSEEKGAIDFNLHNRLFGRANRALTLLAARHPGPLNLLGTSLGALFSISALARIPQVEKAVLIVGGIPFTEVIVGSDTMGMNFLREKRKEKFGVTGKEDYLARLNEVFEWNDLDKLTPEAMKDKQILLIIGLADDGVPTKNQLLLAERFPQAKIIRHDSDHFGTIVKSFLIDYTAIKKFIK